MVKCLDESLYPEFPKAKDLSNLILDISVKLETYKNEEFYKKLYEHKK